MYLKTTKLLCLSVLLWCAGGARAEIYKSVDADGHVTYSSTPSKGAVRLGLEPIAPPSHSSRSYSSRQSRKRSNSTPRDFPRVDRSTQRRRDDMRYKILSDELVSEQKLLAQARAKLKQGEGSRDETKLKSLRDDVTLHTRNISALKTEMSHIK